MRAARLGGVGVAVGAAVGLVFACGAPFSAAPDTPATPDGAAGPTGGGDDAAVDASRPLPTGVEGGMVILDAGTDALDAAVIDAGPPDAPCAPGPKQSPREAPCMVSDDFGVFVAPAANGGSDMNDGSMATPLATVTKGLTVAKTKNKRLFVCAATYAENVTVTETGTGVQAFGALKCGTWQVFLANDILATLAPPTGTVLDIGDTTTGVVFESFAFVAQSNPSHGGSTIAVFAHNATGVGGIL